MISDEVDMGAVLCGGSRTNSGPRTDGIHNISRTTTCLQDGLAISMHYCSFGLLGLIRCMPSTIAYVLEIYTHVKMHIKHYVQRHHRRACDVKRLALVEWR